uniref:Uncharacterized protein n=1 Tax=Tetranychus urticae TaxID=32264 RepID=T1KL91_TETUR
MDFFYQIMVHDGPSKSYLFALT